MKDDKKTRKANLYKRIEGLFAEHKNFLLLQMDNIISSQLQECKKAWKGRAEFLIAKNTTVKSILKDVDFSDSIKGNVAFLFIKDERDFKDIKNIIDTNERRSYGRCNAIAQNELFIEPTITPLSTERAPYFQALGITYKVTKEKLEILQRYKVFGKGDKVNPAQARLLTILDIQAFLYKIEILAVHENGDIYNPFIIGLTAKDAENSVANVASQIMQASVSMKSMNRLSSDYFLKEAVLDCVSYSLSSNFAIKEAAAFN